MFLCCILYSAERCIIPEGPEVKKIGERLAEYISGQTLISAEIISGRYTKKAPTGWESFVIDFPIDVIGVGVHGKFLYWICQNETFVYSTLGMTGNWSRNRSKHSRMKFSFSSGDIFYNDQRNFGTLKIVNGKHSLISKLRNLGPDPLQGEIENETFISCLRKKRDWQITKALMDQSVLAGIGNYIKSDSLWLARISPLRLVSDLSDDELENLNKCITRVMSESYNGVGVYQSGNKAHFVYGKKKDPDGNIIKKETTMDNRATYWVPKIQK